VTDSELQKRTEPAEGYTRIPDARRRRVRWAFAAVLWLTALPVGIVVMARVSESLGGALCSALTYGGIALIPYQKRPKAE
jgi:hypothetical protein